MKETEKKDIDLILIPFLAKIITDERQAEKAGKLQLDALRRLRSQLIHYQELGYPDRLISAIAEKKGGRILSVTNKKEMEKLLRPACPHYNGAEFVPDEYGVPEEELICWSETSLRAPLNDAGFKRYMELFRQFFPEEAKEIFT